VAVRARAMPRGGDAVNAAAAIQCTLMRSIIRFVAVYLRLMAGDPTHQ
jgi:hypothetical protein